MAARPYWSGQIRLSLVAVPVNIFAALEAVRNLPMHEIYRRTGDRVQHQLIAGDKKITRNDVVKGYEYKKGRYVLLEPDEIKALKLPSKDTLEIVQFVPRTEIDPLYFDKPYYVVPKDDNAEDAFATIREGLRKTGTYGLGQLTIAGRERLCALKPCGRGMMLETIRYRDEIRKADQYFEDIENSKVGKDELSLIEQLIKKKNAEFKPETFHDHYREALRELIDAKLENREPEYEESPSDDGKVINLMDALRQSVSGKSSAKKMTKKSTKNPAKKPSGKVTAIPRPKHSTSTKRRKAG
ncbi:Ku protein [bacterium]|nr:Ku protein [bacterium]